MTNEEILVLTKKHRIYCGIGAHIERMRIIWRLPNGEIQIKDMPENRHKHIIHQSESDWLVSNIVNICSELDTRYG